MEPPKIAVCSDLSLADAIVEYRYLTEYPTPEHGWSRPVQLKISDRMLRLQRIVTEHILRLEKTMNEKKDKINLSETGQLTSPEVTGETTPAESPENVGHLSGGEVQQLLSLKNKKEGK